MGISVFHGEGKSTISVRLVERSRKTKEVRQNARVYQRKKLEDLEPYMDHRSLEQKRQDAWYASFDSLMRFYKVHGHLMVTKHEDRKLFNWIRYQRELDKKKSCAKREKYNWKRLVLHLNF